ncbi:tetratricopeptide repeat protein [Actinoplanes sp. CA-015351]|uniref:tetratricopeptide repeat protein n=1 Tax=Actinoplanes sp. CA-015351 TaxID=3239897 RepID=UPI003D966076
MAEEFLAREDEQDRFVSVLKHAQDRQDLDEGYLLVVHGHGGIGKTELLRRFREIVRGQVRHAGISNRFHLVEVDWNEHRRERHADYVSWAAGPPAWVALDALYDSLRDEVTGWRARRRVTRAFADYRERATKLKEEQPVAPEPSLLPDIVGAAIGGLAPIAGVEAASEPLTRVAATVTHQAQERFQRRGRRYETVTEDEALVRAFATGLKQVSRRRPIVLILDTAEILGDIRRRLITAVRRSGGRTVWVWGIRLEDEANAAEDSEITTLRRSMDNARLRLVPLSRFDDRTIQRYLQARLPDAEISAETVRDVAALTHGIPLAVQLAADLLSKGVPPADVRHEVSSDGEVSTVIRDLARRYLIHLREASDATAENDLILIYGLALMNDPSNDPDLLGALWDVPAELVAATLDELAGRHDFVLSRGHRMHQEIRRTIRLFLLDPVRRPEVRAANERAVEFLRDRMNEFGRITTESRLADADWCATANQLLWHTFWINPRDGVRMLAELTPAAHVLEPTLAAGLLQAADWFAPICTPEQRTAIAGTRVLMPTGTFLHRLQGVFRGSVSGLSALPALNPALAVISDTAEGDVGILASDVPPAFFARLLRLDQQNEAATGEELADLARLLPETGAERLSRLIAARLNRAIRDIINQGGAADAVEIARLAVRLAPDDPVASGILAETLLAAGESQLAFDAIEAACRMNPDSAGLQNQRGIILRFLDRDQEALAAYELGCSLEPYGAYLHSNRGGQLAKIARWEESAAAYREACRLQPHHPFRHTNLGAALEKLGQYEEALAAYEEARRLDPDGSGLYSSRGVVLVRLGRMQEGIATFRQGVTLDPASKVLLNNCGEALLLAGQDDEAIQMLTSSLETTASDHLEAIVLLGLLVKESDPERARELCRQALTQSGADVLRCRRGELRAIALAVLGRFDEAEEELAQALSAWTGSDPYQGRLYDLLDAGDGKAIADRLRGLWERAGVPMETSDRGLK